ncbi:MAG: hypothetical protein M3Y05_12050 [Gemmatimonadota bacterium]|nr:hypothetical protein [Gemmatimonadota bacterium]
MSRLRIAFLLPVALTMVGASAMAATAQSTGWVALYTHVGPSAARVPLPITHTYVQGTNGLVEYNSEEFSPGTHTFARVEGEYHNCTATAENVTFTITAGKWTYVDVPMVFKSCQFSIAAGSTGLPGGDGFGTVLLATLADIGPSSLVASCTLVPGTSSYYLWSDFHACTGQASNQTVRSGTTNVPMLEFLLTPASPQTITGVTVAASGTGNEQVDVSAVNLYLDKNGNGAVDAGDSVIATGTFATNDGIVSLAVNPGLNITAPTSLLVTYSFTVTIAERIGGGIVLAMFPLLILPSFRRRKTLLAMLVVMLTTVAITACGGDSSTGPKPGNGSVTFKSTLTGITTSTGTLSSLAVSGATITVNK